MSVIDDLQKISRAVNIISIEYYRTNKEYFRIMYDNLNGDVFYLSIEKRHMEEFFPNIKENLTEIIKDTRWVNLKLNLNGSIYIDQDDEIKWACQIGRYNLLIPLKEECLMAIIASTGYIRNNIVKYLYKLYNFVNLELSEPIKLLLEIEGWYIWKNF